MNVASIENCKKLYELSGWKDTKFAHARGGALANNIYPEYISEFTPPAYDLGYLLRRLPNGTRLMYNNERSAASYQVSIGEILLYGDTPEDAAAKLAIELINKGIIGGEDE